MTVTLYRLRGEAKHPDEQGDPRSNPQLWETIEVDEDRLVTHHAISISDGGNAFSMVHPLSCRVVVCAFDARACRWISGVEPLPYAIAAVVDVTTKGEHSRGEIPLQSGRFRWDEVDDKTLIEIPAEDGGCLRCGGLSCSACSARAQDSDAF